MESSIKELIELSTKSGSISLEARNLIYQKAEEKNISKTECDIYIDGYINQINKEDKVINSGNRRWGYWLIICGILDLIWLVINIDIINRALKYGIGSGTVFFWIFSIIVILFFGSFLLGELRRFLLIAGILIIGLFAIIPIVVILDLIGIHIQAKDKSSAIIFLVDYGMLFYFFGKKCFGEKHGKQIGIGVAIVIFIVMMIS